MSLDRSTPSSHGKPAFSPPIAQQLSGSTRGFTSNNAVPLTRLELFCLGRSDSTFNAMAGAVGGFASGVVTCPLDVIKTKLQAQGGFRAQQGSTGTIPTSTAYNGMLGTARTIWKEEGLRGMYRGLGPIVLGYLPTWAVWFTVYGNSKEFFSKYEAISNPNVVNFCSSIVAGGCSTMVTNPIWVIKTRLMSQGSQTSTSNNARPPWHYKSTLDAARKMYATEGFLSFYSGLTPALLGLTHVAVQFPAYEFLKLKFTGEGMGMSTEGGEGHWLGILSASVLSKIMASSATYPHEVIRTRLQTQQRSVPSSSPEYTAFRGGLEGSENHNPAAIVAKAKAVRPRYKGIVTTFKTILAEEGWRAFYAGMGTNMMRAVPAATTTLLTYEFLMKQFNHTKMEALAKLEELNDGW